MATPSPPPASHGGSSAQGPSMQQHQFYPQAHPQAQQHHYGHPPAHMHPHAHPAHPHHLHQPIAGPNPELLPGPEWAYYDRLFQEALGGQHAPGGHTSFLHGPAAVAFLSRSGLPKPALRQIWALCDPQGHGFLARPQFHLAMRLVAMAQAGYIDPMDPTLPARVQARDPLFVSLPQLAPVRLDAADPEAPPMPQQQQHAQPVVASREQHVEDEDEDKFGDFEAAASYYPPAPSPPTAQSQPTPAPSLPAAAAPATIAPALEEEEDDDDFGDFHAAEAHGTRQGSVAGVVTASSSISSSTSIADSGAATRATFEEVAVSTTTASVAATVGPTGVTGLAVLSSHTATITAASSAPAPALAPALSDMAARMAAFDAIVEEHDWGEFEEAEAGPAAPEAQTPPTAPTEAPAPLAMAPAASAGAADLLMGLGAEAGATPTPVISAEQPALSFGIGSALLLLSSTSSSSSSAVKGGGTLLDLDLLAPTTTAPVIENPFAAATQAPAFSGAQTVFPDQGVLGGSVGGGAGMARFMTETPPSSPKQVQEHQYRSPSPPLPSIHGLALDQPQAAAGNPFASAEPANPSAASLAAAGMGIEGNGSLMGLAGAGIGTGSIYEMSPYADPDAQGPSPPLGAASPHVGGVGDRAGPGKAEKEDALTSAFRQADAAASTSGNFGGTGSNSVSRSHTGPFSPPPASTPSLPLPTTAAPASAAALTAADPFGFAAEGPTAAAIAPVFDRSSTGGGDGGDDEWGAFDGGAAAAAASAAEPTLAPAAVLAVPALASDDPFAGLHGDEDGAVAAGAIQHEEVSPSSRGSTSPDRALGGKATDADAVEQQPPPPQQQQHSQQLQQNGEEGDEWGGFLTAAAKEEASAAPPAPVVTPASISKQQESTDPWSHPDPWGTETSQPVSVGGGGASASAFASASVGSILLDPLHAPPPPETAALDGGLAAVLPRLWAKGLLGPAVALTEHLEAQRALPEAAAACEAAKREDRLEEALALKRRMRELEGRVASEAQVAAWRALVKGGDGEEQEERDALLERLRKQVEAGAGAERAEAFAQAFVVGKPTLAAEAKGGGARGALRRARQARRCAALVVGMAAAGEEEEGGAGGDLAAYPQHWQRTLATAGAKLGEAAGFCRRVTALPSAETRKEVGASLKVWTFVEASVEILRVARFVRAAAGDALLELAAQDDGVETLAEELRAAIGEMGLEATVAAAWPLDVAGVRDAVADCGGDEGEGELVTPPKVDPRRVCNLCLLPLAAARALGGANHAPVPVTYFSGAAYHSACCNLWLNAISLETPQPVMAAGERAGAMGAAGLSVSGDAMDGSVSVNSGLSIEDGVVGNGDAAAAAVPAAPSEGAVLAEEVPF